MQTHLGHPDAAEFEQHPSDQLDARLIRQKRDADAIKAREDGRIEARKRHRDQLAAEQKAIRLERIQSSIARQGNTVKAPDADVWELLLAGTIDEVADHLEVTASTLTRWMRDPTRAAEFQTLLSDRGLVAAMAIQRIGQDDTRDPQSRAVDGKFRQWEAERMNKQQFGNTEPAPNIGIEGRISAALALLIAKEAGIQGLTMDDRSAIEHRP